MIICSIRNLFIFIDKKLWWADHNLAQLGTCSKRDGRNPAVLRNKTSGVVHMKVYDKAAQQGTSHWSELVPPFEYIMFSFFRIIFSIQQLTVPIFSSNIKKGESQILLNTTEDISFIHVL